MGKSQELIGILQAISIVAKSLAAKLMQIEKEVEAYDKVGPEYVINEAQAKTVRKIFDMYLAGNGSQKIKKQLEKDGDLTAMGK